MNLCGEHIHSIDAKNRIFIPAKYREEFGEKVMIVRDHKRKCLLIYSLDEWNKYQEQLSSAIPASKIRDFRRFLYRTSLETTYDSQGRVMLTGALCEHASLQKGTAIIVGCGNLAEIWNEANLAEQIANEDASEYDAMLEQYGV